MDKFFCDIVYNLFRNQIILNLPETLQHNLWALSQVKCINTITNNIPISKTPSDILNLCLQTWVQIPVTASPMLFLSIEKVIHLSRFASAFPAKKHKNKEIKHLQILTFPTIITNCFFHTDKRLFSSEDIFIFIVSV